MADVMSLRDIETKATRLNIDLSTVDWNRIWLPPGLDLGMKSDDDEDSLEIDVGFGNFIFVDNLPVVPREKFEKLERLVRKIYNQSHIGEIKEFWMPVEEQIGETQGYCFIEYNTAREARSAKKTNGFKLDKAHILSVSILDELGKFMRPRVPSETIPYTSRENLYHWLTDEKGRDQFVIRAGLYTEVLWNDATQVTSDPVCKRPFWTESFVQWSPLGTYLATVHSQYTAVWGGASTFNRLMRYNHPQVKWIDFSPGEKYLVTCSSLEQSNPPYSCYRVCIKIFDVRTGKGMREFGESADEFAFGGFTGVSFPAFRWGGGKEDKYFAILGKKIISVYNTETFSLIGKKSIEAENMMDFSWSPVDPIFALVVPEQGGGNRPARMSLYQIPSKEELRQKYLFSVSDCNLYWQSEGEYLAVKVDRYTKTKKTTYTSFEFFRIRERDKPIETFELKSKNDKIIAFAWEPKGNRFAIIHGDNPRPDISFYSMKGGKVSKLTTLKQKQVNALFWAPGGRFVILAGLKEFNGQLEFYYVDELQSMATCEHFMATDIEWDPSGRYVATSVSSVHEMENGVNIWSLNGKLLYRILKVHFDQFSWRPRPPSLLSPEKEEEILKNLKEYSKKYNVEDQYISLLLSEQEHEKKQQLEEEWDHRVNE